MKMDLAEDKVHRLCTIRNAIKDILPGDISIYGLDAPYQEIFVLDIDKSGALEDVSIYYEDGEYIINFWTCKPHLPLYNSWLLKYAVCLSLLIEGEHPVPCKVLFDDGGTDEAVCLREALDTLLEKVKENMELPR